MKINILEDIAQDIEVNKKAKQILNLIVKKLFNHLEIVNLRMDGKIIRGGIIRLKEVDKSIDLQVFFGLDNENRRFNPEYDDANKRIVIPIRDEDWYDLEDNIYLYKPLYEENLVPEIEKALTQTQTQSILIHEITHYFDFQRLKPTFDKRMNINYYLKYLQYGADYFNDDLELNARWQQILEILMNNKWDKNKDIKTNVNIAIDLINQFPNLEKFLSQIRTKNKRKLLKRIANYILSHTE